MNHLDEDTLNGAEVKMWIENIKNKGLINISIPMLGEYTSSLIGNRYYELCIIYGSYIIVIILGLLKYIIQKFKRYICYIFTIAYIECLLTG